MPLISVHDIEMYDVPHGQGTPLIGGPGLDVSEMSALIGPLAERFRDDPSAGH